MTLDEHAALRAILEGTASEVGEGFFAALARSVAEALGTCGAWVTEYLERERRLRAFAFWLDGRFVPDFNYDITDTPCEPVVASGRVVHVPDEVMRLYPRDPDLRATSAVSYLGMPLLDGDGRVLGHLAVLDRRPMPAEERTLTIFRIFAARAAAELRRLRAEQDVREREQQLDRLVNGMMDAVVELDGALAVTMANTAAERLFARPAGEIVGRPFAALLAPESAEAVTALAATLADRPAERQSSWIGGGLTAIGRDGERVPAEATISRGVCRGAPRWTLVLRDVRERLEAERCIATLAGEAAYLRDEIRALHHAGEILGDSAAIRGVLDEVARVAPTDATVLILGETGTGKELVARAVHAGSRRAERPLVKVNCAALPAALIESELFGHEPGAFTGATKRREGRFVLADRGTLFLDEIGELPIELQAKLLRVLQDGELEPLGSSTTRRVDVRIIAATNRDLRQAVARSTFREDLYYRLSVYPLTLPPLRERPDDIPVLAAAFARRVAQKIGRPVPPLTPADVARLQGYHWPGNVRELEHVIERAVIAARSEGLELERVLPLVESEPRPPVAGTAPDVIRTAAELRELERQNVLRALERADWRISGPSGAARLLGLHPSTLASRMKALKIRRPE